jgi:hypothetical protein
MTRSLALCLLLAALPGALAQQPPAKKNPPPLTDADLQKMPPAEVKELFKKVKLPEDDPDPDPGNKEKKGAPSTGAVTHKGMNYGPCLASTVDLPDPKKKKGDEAGANVVLRGLTIKLDHDTTVCYDLDTLAVAAVWTGGFLDLSKTNHENSKGAMAPQVPWPEWFTNINTPGWADKDGKFEDPRPGKLGPLPHVKYRGHYLFGGKVILKYEVNGREVLEMPGAEKHGEQIALSRTFVIAPADKAATLLIATGKGKGVGMDIANSHFAAAGIKQNNGTWVQSVVVGFPKAKTRAEYEDGRLPFKIAASKEATTFKVLCAVGTFIDVGAALIDAAEKSKAPANLARFLSGGPKRWGDPLETKGTLAKDDGKSPYVEDTLTLPFDNPFKSWMRTAALDFFSDGRLAVSTLSGDVWIVSGIDKELQALKWTRFATGLYEPLGLKIVKDQVYVLGRDRITRLHDLNGDGEADFYESFWADGNVAPSFHAFSFDLQTDKAGNFYFVKSGRRVEKERTGHGALIKVSPDGQKSEVVATGFRHPNGMGIGPGDEIVVSDNQGEWIPSSKVSLVKPGGFYGYPRVGDPTPKTYDAPLFWLPMSVDNSSGGQCWATSDKWGPLSGKLLHTSYGTCELMYCMTQKVEGTWNAAVVEFPFVFKSGIMRARVNPADGQVYVVGLRGWQTRAVDVGCVERVRYTGVKACLVTNVTVSKNRIALDFSEPIDEASAMGPKDKAIKVDQWNYIWSRNYGSPHMAPSEPTKAAHDVVPLKGLGFPNKGKTLYLMLENELQPVHQLRIRLDLRAADGTQVRQTVYLTINGV